MNDFLDQSFTSKTRGRSLHERVFGNIEVYLVFIPNLSVTSI